MLVCYLVSQSSTPVNSTLTCSNFSNLFLSVYIGNGIVTIFKTWGIPFECTNKCRKIAKAKDTYWQLD